MAGIGLRTSISDRPHRITLQNPGPPVEDVEGGYTQTWTDLDPPAVQASIEPASAEDLETVAAGTVISQASHVIRFPYHPGVTTDTRIGFNGRTFSVIGVQNREERNVETVTLCSEHVE